MLIKSQKKQNIRVINSLFKELFSRFPLHFIFLFLLIMTQAFFNTLSVIAVAPITDFLMDNKGEKANIITQNLEFFLSNYGIELDLLFVCIFYGGLMVAIGLTGTAVQYALLRIKYDVLIHLLTGVMGKFFRARFLFFSQGNMGKMLNSFQQEVNKVGDTFGHIAMLCAYLVQMTFFLIAPFFLNFKLTVIFLSLIIFFTLPIKIFRNLSYKLGLADTETSNVITGVLHENLNAAKLITSFGRQEKAVFNFKEAFRKHSIVSVKFQTLLRGIPLLFFPLGVISALSTLYIAYLEGIPLSDMAMILFAFSRLMPIIGSIMQSKSNIDGFIPAYEQVKKLSKKAEELQEAKGFIRHENMEKGIMYTDVSFSFPGKKETLSNINISIKKGEMTAFIGDSGSGKTTLVDLMIGLYQPNRGKIMLDDKNLEDYDITSFRNQVGYVPQDPFLFNNSIRENLLWSKPEASEKDIWEACRIANSEQFIKELPEKLETILGDRGIRLSGGQRQRIALARAIIRKPDLLILDEATSSLDSSSEKKIQESIDNLTGKTTLVVVAHRLSTIRNANYIYVLEKGEIIEEGKFSILANNSKSKLATMIRDQVIV